MRYDNPKGPDELKEFAKDNGVNMGDILALARQNDPFACGTKTQIEQAEWFLNLWNKFGYTTGVHLRRIHYQIVSQRERSTHTGETYQNTVEHWGYLCESAKFARSLRYVPVNAFEDHRNPPPITFVTPRGNDPVPGVDIWMDSWQMPTINTELAAEFPIASPWVHGYDYHPSDQPYHLEVWVEKSTMNDALKPVCEQYGANLVTSLGFQSITGVVNLLERIEARGKPARIFYISDFDPAGDGMPTAVARQIEYWFDTFVTEPDILLTPICLTLAQVKKWKLPSTPIKLADLRRANFEDRYGYDGAVELDAMEALYPGELAKIVRNAFEPYFDNSLDNNLYQANRKANNIARSEWREYAADEISDAENLALRIQTVTDCYQDRLQDLKEDMDVELAALAEEMEEIKESINAKAESFMPGLPDRPEAEQLEYEDRTDALLDTDREYLEQIAVYKARKAGE